MCRRFVLFAVLVMVPAVLCFTSHRRWLSENGQQSAASDDSQGDNSVQQRDDSLDSDYQPGRQKSVESVGGKAWNGERVYRRARNASLENAAEAKVPKVAAQHARRLRSHASLTAAPASDIVANSSSNVVEHSEGHAMTNNDQAVLDIIDKVLSASYAEEMNLKAASKEANIKEAYAKEADLTEAKNASVRKASATEANVKESVVTETNVQQSTTTKEAISQEVNAKQTDARKLSADEVNAKEAIDKEADTQEATIKEANTQGAGVKETTKEPNAEEASTKEATTKGANVEQTTVKEANTSAVSTSENATLTSQMTTGQVPSSISSTTVENKIIMDEKVATMVSNA